MTENPTTARHLVEQLRDEARSARALLATMPDDGRPERRRATASTLSLVADLLADACDLYDPGAAPGPRDPLVRERLAAEDRLAGPRTFGGASC